MTKSLKVQGRWDHMDGMCVDLVLTRLVVAIFYNHVIQMFYILVPLTPKSPVCVECEVNLLTHQQC